MPDLDPKWTLPASSPNSWFAGRSAFELANLLKLLPSNADDQVQAGYLYYRVKRAAKKRGTCANGYYDFEGPLTQLRTLDLIEVVSMDTPNSGAVSPSCVGSGTWRIREGEPVTWTFRMTPLGVQVREYWSTRSPYSGTTFFDHQNDG